MIGKNRDAIDEIEAMTIATQQPITLEAFLKLPETKPASEYINGAIIQKPMPKGKHSQLQLRLCNAVNEIGVAQQTVYALPELRCTFGTRSLVPDVAVFQWSRIPFDADGEIPNDFLMHPDWVIEILSPEQASNRVTGNILHCLHHGCSLGWLIGPGDRSILAFLPKQEPVLYEGNDLLPVLAGVPLELTVQQVFNWLKMSG
ncbi:Uma2 family endonuclease [Stenomitos frigidus]